MIDELEMSQSPKSNDLLYSAKAGRHKTIEGEAAEMPSITIENMDLDGRARKRKLLNDIFMNQKAHVERESQMRKKKSQPHISQNHIRFNANLAGYRLHKQPPNEASNQRSLGYS